MSLTVDVISDVICPWCYIGKRRLEKAVAALGGPVKVRWLPFQLNPTMAKEGVSRREYRTKKFGSWGRSQELDARVVAAGQSEGIHFAYDCIERTPNTLDAHRLIGLAERQGVQDAVVEALFRAYFTEGRDISNRQTLLDVVAEAGLDRHEAEALLNSEDGLEAIKDGDGEPAVLRCYSETNNPEDSFKFEHNDGKRHGGTKTVPAIKLLSAPPNFRPGRPRKNQPNAFE